MHCHEVQNIIRLHPQNELPAEVNEHLSHCTVCRSYALLHYFTENPTQIDLFPTIDFKDNILRQLEKSHRKTRVLRLTSIAASILLGLVLGLLLQYYLFSSTPTVPEKTYQFTDVLMMDLYDVNNNSHE